MFIGKLSSCTYMRKNTSKKAGYPLFIAQRAADYGTHARVGLTLVLLGRI